METSSHQNTTAEPNDRLCNKSSPYKLVILGEAPVGKTALIMRFIQNQFEENTSTTIGAHFARKTLPMGSKVIDLQIWDTAGVKAMKSLLPMYYKRADAAIVVYDIQSTDSYDYAKTLVKKVQQEAHLNIEIALVGNKVDRDHEREVDFEEAEKYAEENGLLFMETSAKTGMNVMDIFVAVSRKLLNECDLKQEKVQLVELTGKETIQNRCMI